MTTSLLLVSVAASWFDRQSKLRLVYADFDLSARLFLAAIVRLAALRLAT